MVFCNSTENPPFNVNSTVTILILIDGFLQCGRSPCSNSGAVVTILILIDGFLQYIRGVNTVEKKDSHNPYFNRWFSAIAM